MGQLLSWLLLYFGAYGLWIYGIGGVDCEDSFRESGSSLFTLGFAHSTECGSRYRLDPVLNVTRAL